VAADAENILERWGVLKDNHVKLVIEKEKERGRWREKKPGEFIYQEFLGGKCDVVTRGKQTYQEYAVHTRFPIS
jgi:hypothetical protein